MKKGALVFLCIICVALNVAIALIMPLVHIVMQDTHYAVMRSQPVFVAGSAEELAAVDEYMTINYANYHGMFQSNGYVSVEADISGKRINSFGYSITEHTFNNSYLSTSADFNTVFQGTETHIPIIVGGSRYKQFEVGDTLDLKLATLSNENEVLHKAVICGFFDTPVVFPEYGGEDYKLIISSAEAIVVFPSEYYPVISNVGLLDYEMGNKDIYNKLTDMGLSPTNLGMKNYSKTSAMLSYGSAQNKGIASCILVFLTLCLLAELILAYFIVADKKTLTILTLVLTVVPALLLGLLPFATSACGISVSRLVVLNLGWLIAQFVGIGIILCLKHRVERQKTKMEDISYEEI